MLKCNYYIFTNQKEHLSSEVPQFSFKGHIYMLTKWTVNMHSNASTLDNDRRQLLSYGHSNASKPEKEQFQQTYWFKKKFMFKAYRFIHVPQISISGWYIWHIQTQIAWGSLEKNLEPSVYLWGLNYMFWKLHGKC